MVHLFSQLCDKKKLFLTDSTKKEKLEKERRGMKEGEKSNLKTERMREGVKG
jgi:hypothetical protein